MNIRFAGEPLAIRRVGLDTEALPWVTWHDKPYGRHVLCIGWGELDDVHYIESRNRRAGHFSVRDLKRFRADIVESDVVVVGHNAMRFDLPAVNGVLISHDLEPLPTMRAQDTMGNLKTGYAFRNTLKAQCARYGVQLKTGGPDWDRVLMGDADEWRRMRDYNVNDVVCTLQLERALAAAGLPVAIETWEPRKGGRR